MPLTHIQPSSMNKPTGYTHVIIAEGVSKIIYLAGQTATGPDGNVVGVGDLMKQAEQVYANINTCLAAAGATFANVTKMTTFIVNYKPEYREVVAAMRQKYLSSEKPPASTLLGVQSLARPEFLIEVEMVAVI